jgi:hypothetical protein
VESIISFLKNTSSFLKDNQHIFIILGVFLTYFQLRRNTIAHQDEHSPFLILNNGERDDPVNVLLIKNVGNLRAVRIHIDIYNVEKRYFCKKLFSTDIRFLEIQDSKSIYNSRNANFNPADYDTLLVKIKYCSPLHKRKLVIKENVKR